MYLPERILPGIITFVLNRENQYSKTNIMKSVIFNLLILTIMTCACTPKNTQDPEKWSDSEVKSWFDKGEWKQGWAVAPDASIDQREFAIQYHKNPEVWNKAFTFLKSTPLDTLSKGRHEIDGDFLYANADQYTTKNEEVAKFEAHRKYADIQYVISGNERIGVRPLAKGEITEDYVDAKDVLFLRYDDKNYQAADPGKFFIFFPADAHSPGVKADTNMVVHKVVLKVRVN